MESKSSKKTRVIGKIDKTNECKNDAFDGAITKEKKRCIVSFPGKYHDTWNGLTTFATEQLISTACVFFPDSHSYFGTHAKNTEDNESCYCLKLYTKQEPWGCTWFQAWKENVRLAHSFKHTLIVVYKMDEVGKGDKVEWGKLGECDPNGEGLGGSQRGEVAWLLKHKIPFEKEDVKALMFQTKQKLTPTKPLDQMSESELKRITFQTNQKLTPMKPLEKMSQEEIDKSKKK
jgi:hypothetical protein